MNLIEADLIRDLKETIKHKDEIIINQIEELDKLIAESTEWESKYYDLQEELKSANESITWYSNRFKAVERDNEIYKLRHNNAIKKLSSAINHYNLEDKNNTILFVKEILEGNDISEKSYIKLNGGDDNE